MLFVLCVLIVGIIIGIALGTWRNEDFQKILKPKTFESDKLKRCEKLRSKKGIRCHYNACDIAVRLFHASDDFKSFKDAQNFFALLTTAHKKDIHDLNDILQRDKETTKNIKLDLNKIAKNLSFKESSYYTDKPPYCTFTGEKNNNSTNRNNKIDNNRQKPNKKNMKKTNTSSKQEMPLHEHVLPEDLEIRHGASLSNKTNALEIVHRYGLSKKYE